MYDVISGIYLGRCVQIVKRGGSGGRVVTQVEFQSRAVEYYSSSHSEGSRRPVVSIERVVPSSLMTGLLR